MEEARIIENPKYVCIYIIIQEEEYHFEIEKHKLHKVQRPF